DVARVRPAAVVSFGNPYIVAQLPGAGTFMLAWGQWPAQQIAAARALAGDAAIDGRLPIPLPPGHAIGDGIVRYPDTVSDAPASDRVVARSVPNLFPPDRAGMDARLNVIVDSIVSVALDEGVAPGAAVAIGRSGRLVHLRGYGRTDSSADSEPVSDSTLWDMASLTKVVVTTTLAMMLVDEDRLDLDARLSRYLPEWPDTDSARRVTVRHLLRHDGGFVAYGPLWREARGRHAYLERIANVPLDYEPGTRTVYSDYGIILLGLIVEHIAGAPLDVLANARILAPLGMTDSGFRPLGWTDRGRIAPTEVDTVFRMRHVRGEVHDENAFALGGVAGHAGLFSSARDLAVFANLLLASGETGGRQLIREATLREFTRRQSEASSRALGWDTPAPGSSAGEWFSESSFGHTGFTGTSVWVDPARDVFVAILTNRVNPTRDNQRHTALRRDLADAVQQAIRDRPVVPRARE
ncbi:MAG: serine hydrolase, partial [Gemmatimonadetes bacterium]|nr:serine hydrolase [Gemmatimonadota bacterium]